MQMNGMTMRFLVSLKYVELFSDSTKKLHFSQ